MARRPRRNHSPAFKAKVAVAAINRGGVRPDIRVMIDTDLVLRFGYFDTRTFL